MSESEVDFVELVNEVRQIDQKVQEDRKAQSIIFEKQMKRRAVIKRILKRHCIDGNGDHKWRPHGPYESYCEDCGANR